MINLEALRLALLATLVLVAQAAFASLYPEWRAGADFYIVFLMLTTAARGPLYGGVYALAGGAVMDSLSCQLPVFHVFYYLLPVAAAVLLRRHMLLNYGQLAASITLVLLAIKVLLQYIVCSSLGWLTGVSPLLHVNYISLFFVALITLVSWPRLSTLVIPLRSTA